MRTNNIFVVGVQILNQLATNVQEVLENIDIATRLISSHAKTFPFVKNTVYLLPELSSSGYGVKTFENLSKVAEDEDGPSFRCFSALAKEYGCHICYGFPRKSGQLFCISQGVVSPTGKLVLIYDKVHICQFGSCVEKMYFSRPDIIPRLPFFTINSVNIGIAICYDIRFPEYTRKLAIEHNIHVLLHAGGWSRDTGFITWHTFVITRAVENQIYIMSNNRASENNGATIFCPPMISETSKVQVLGTEEGLIVGEISVDFIRKARNEHNYRGDRLSKY